LNGWVSTKKDIVSEQTPTIEKADRRHKRDLFRRRFRNCTVAPPRSGNRGANEGV